jgi:chromosome segregation ATPase
MDPRNRETIAQMIVSSISGSDAQYLVITPSQITFAQKDLRIITVQNIEGASIVKETR